MSGVKETLSARLLRIRITNETFDHQVRRVLGWKWMQEIEECFHQYIEIV